jgi:hypothetical protein
MVFRHPRGRRGPAAATDATTAVLRITYPADGTLFPPESVAPTFPSGRTGRAPPTLGRRVRDAGGGEVVRDSVDAPRWRPSEETWRKIKQRSLERCRGDRHRRPPREPRNRGVLSRAHPHVEDPVGDSLFYRECRCRS